MLFSVPEPAGRAAIEDRHLSLDVRFVPKSRRRDFYSIVSVVVPYLSPALMDAISTHVAKASGVLKA
jgi:hypothetical protein